MSMLPHGVCTVCGREMTLKKDGTLRHHGGSAVGTCYGRAYMCDGTGKPPVVAPGPNRNPQP